MPTPRPGPRLSRRADWLESSLVREILQLAGRPGMTSFAGGLPAAACFPQLDWSGFPSSALQYGPSEGDGALREHVAGELNARGLRCAASQVLILSGSQQGIDLAAKLFIDPGVPIAVEQPTYLAALQVFRFFGARIGAFDRDDPAGSLARQARPAFAYVIPTFQNPTGHCYSLAERQDLAQACASLAVPLFEDDPYRDLVYDDCERRPACALLPADASWIYQGSFSKSLAPGLRLGYLAASPDLVTPLTRLKQAADLHSCRISQWQVLRLLTDPQRPRQLAQVTAHYRAKRDHFAAVLERHFTDLARWQSPPGGLFFWLTLKAPFDTRQLLDQAVERGVTFMPGEVFFADPDTGHGHLRLNFSHPTEAEAATGLEVLANLLRAYRGQA